MRRAGACAAVAVVAAMAAASPVVHSQEASARFTREVPWGSRGGWIALDSHVHSQFSDGGATIAELVANARRHGCDAIAVTDHADRSLRGATPAFHAAIQAARADNPDVIVLAGLEWNVPPFGGNEHMTVIVPPGPDELGTLAEFKRRFDDFQRTGEPAPPAEEALAWLAATAAGGEKPVVIHNHPSRIERTSQSNVDDMVRWRNGTDLVVGFEGAPGHQRYTPLGGYKSGMPIDRWDAVAARPGGAWDMLLQRGIDVTAAIAGSDFHNANPSDLHDFWPCEFSETWLRVPERTGAGVLRALRAGSGFAVHGHIAREVDLTVQALGVARPATAGEAVAMRAGASATATVDFVIPELDWTGQPNRVDTVEFILISADAVSVESTPVSGTGRRSVSHPLALGAHGVVVRARGRRIVEDGPDLLFYTNAIRVDVIRP